MKGVAPNDPQLLSQFTTVWVGWNCTYCILRVPLETTNDTAFEQHPSSRPILDKKGSAERGLFKSGP